MFGLGQSSQSGNAGGMFGKPASGAMGFSTPAPAFGQSSFGQQQPTSASIFGQQPSSGGGFGAANIQPQTGPYAFGAAAGQQQSTIGFGQPSQQQNNSLFSSGTSGFNTGAPAQPSGFGQTQQPLFGQSSGGFGFGQSQAASGSVFGQSSTQAGTSFFGQKPATFGQTQSNLGFGQGVGMGQSTQSGGFAQSKFGQPTTSTFGQASAPFGQSPFAGFGQSQPATGQAFGGSNLFAGTSQPASGFGQQMNSNFGGFNSQQQTGFGASSASGFGGFGQQQSGFGAKTVSGDQGKMFTPSSSTSQEKIGTKNAQYRATKDNSKGAGNTKFQSITAMPQFRGKSLEELRFEDQLGKSAVLSSPGNTFGLAGSSSLFGQTQTQSGINPSVGGPTMSLGGGFSFSGTASSFGTPGTTQAPSLGSSSFNQGPSQSGFGTSQPSFGASKSGFGTSQPIFGASQSGLGASQPSFGASLSGFGASQPSFGASQPSFGASSSGFGASQPSFGASQPSFGASLSGFGASQPSFGASQPSFGASQPSFGTSQPSFGASLSGFGASQPSFGTSQPSFGASQPSFGASLSGFGASQPSFGTSQPSFSASQSTYSQPLLGKSTSNVGGMQSPFNATQSAFGGSQFSFGQTPSLFGGSQSALGGTQPILSFSQPWPGSHTSGASNLSALGTASNPFGNSQSSNLSIGSQAQIQRVTQQVSPAWYDKTMGHARTPQNVCNLVIPIESLSNGGLSGPPIDNADDPFGLYRLSSTQTSNTGSSTGLLVTDIQKSSHGAESSLSTETENRNRLRRLIYSVVSTPVSAASSTLPKSSDEANELRAGPVTPVKPIDFSKLEDLKSPFSEGTSEKCLTPQKILPAPSSESKVSDSVRKLILEHRRKASNDSDKSSFTHVSEEESAKIRLIPSVEELSQLKQNGESLQRVPHLSAYYDDIVELEWSNLDFSDIDAQELLRLSSIVRSCFVVSGDNFYYEGVGPFLDLECLIHFKIANPVSGIEDKLKEVSKSLGLEFIFFEDNNWIFKVSAKNST